MPRCRLYHSRRRPSESIDRRVNRLLPPGATRSTSSGRNGAIVHRLMRCLHVHAIAVARASIVWCLVSCHAPSTSPSAAAPPSASAAASVHQRFDQFEASRVVPLLSEVLRFPTVAGNAAARDAQQRWLRKTGEALGLAVRPAGLVTEIELEGPK